MDELTLDQLVDFLTRNCSEPHMITDITDSLFRIGTYHEHDHNTSLYSSVLHCVNSKFIDLDESEQYNEIEKIQHMNIGELGDYFGIVIHILDNIDVSKIGEKNIILANVNGCYEPVHTRNNTIFSPTEFKKELDIKINRPEYSLKLKVKELYNIALAHGIPLTKTVGKKTKKKTKKDIISDLDLLFNIS